MFIGWALIGALIGIAAAQKKGFSMVGAVIGGLLLGPLAFLMFFISGISSADVNRKKCPHCAEWIKAEAVICKHCHSAVVGATTVGEDVRERRSPRPPVAR